MNEKEELFLKIILADPKDIKLEDIFRLMELSDEPKLQKYLTSRRDNR